MAEEDQEINILISEIEAEIKNNEDVDTLISLEQPNNQQFIKPSELNQKCNPPEQLNRKRAKHLGRIFIHLLPLLAIFLANYLYILTLEECRGSEHKCVGKLRKKMNFFLRCGCLSALIFSVLLNLSIFKILYKIFIIIIIANISYLCFAYDTGYTFNKHGGWNRLAYLPACLLCTFTIFGLVHIIKQIKKHPRTLPVAIILILILITILIKQRFNGSCVNWEKGLGGVKLDNSGPILSSNNT